MSHAERERGFASYLKHISWNGLGVFLLNNTIVSLMAIHFGASNLELGYINAAFHVTGIVSLAVPRLFRGRRIVRVFGWAWMGRGLVALGYGLLFFMSGSVARITIVLIFTGFSAVRAVGVSVAHAVQRDVMRDREVGGGVVRANIRLSYAQFAAQLLSFGLLSLSFFSGLTGLITISYIGVVMNTVASAYLLRIPGRSVVEGARGDRAFRTALSTLKNRHQLIPMLVHCFGMGLYVLFAFQVVFVRRVLGVPDSMAVLFALAGAIAAILANMGLKPFADSIGEKPLLIIVNAGLVVSAAIWALIPPGLSLYVYYALGFFAYFFLRSLLTLKSAALVKAIPEGNRIAYTATVNVALGIVALLVGLAGGGLADFSSRIPHAVVHQYSLTFLFTALLAGVVTVLSFNLPRGRNLSLRETADIVFSMRNLRAFLDANQLDLAADPAHRESLLLSLERSATPIATKRLRDRLRGPSVAEKERVLRILFRTPRGELLEDIVREALDPAGYVRRDALFALGAYRNSRAESVLRGVVRECVGVDGVGVGGECVGVECVGGEEPRAGNVEDAAVALKSLARHGCDDLLPVIRVLLERSPGQLSPRAELDLALAEALLDPRGAQLETLFERAFARESAGFAVTRLVVALDRVSTGAGVQEYLRTEANTPGRGFTDLLEDAAEFELILGNREYLTELVRREDYTVFGTWIRDVLSLHAAPPLTEWKRLLARSVARVEPPAGLERIGCLCGLYVLHMILDPASGTVEECRRQDQRHR